MKRRDFFRAMAGAGVVAASAEAGFLLAKYGSPSEDVKLRVGHRQFDGITFTDGVELGGDVEGEVFHIRRVRRDPDPPKTYDPRKVVVTITDMDGNVLTEFDMPSFYSGGPIHG